MVISAHRLNRSPSQRFRYEQYIDHLSQNGFEFTFSSLLNAQDDAIFYSEGNNIAKAFILLNSVLQRRKDLARLKDFDIIFIQREASFLGNSNFENAAFKSRAKVIFDFDDSIWLTDTSPGNKKFEWLKDPNKTKTNISNAHLVIAGNIYLADYAKQFNKNVVVIPTTVDTERFFAKPELRNKNRIVIGWSGSISTIKHFELLIPALKKLKEKFGDTIAFKVIGDASYINSELGIKGQAWNADTEVDDLNAFDIGVMPLPNGEWAKGKCALKGLTYMACEIPTVMSNVGVSAEIIQQGINGALCAAETDWVNNISVLIEDAELRNTLGKKGRETVEERFSLTANKQKYLDAFNAILK